MRRGLSLLEILIAAGIMVAAMVPLWGLMGSSHKQVTVSADEIRASQLANEILEQIENFRWFPDPGTISFSLVKNSKISIGSSRKIEVQVGDYPDYLAPQGMIEVEAYPAGNSGRIVRLRIDYKTRERVGKEVKSYYISTFIAR
jgi:hypothetical protein